ncbi:GDP-L-galactose phosphorylase 1 isoform X2 [Hevea brasiliensis]|uniref:GDP-L-galactose phosphorylase 1 isoform X2 n=1 Tax=Hevea brasiliensis TaxID=3981 RepID=UPI0025D0E5D6|nr:GDP-L-galactose phosphorylase 1 isoform X2 [Hevea brasiliensis]
MVTVKPIADNNLLLRCATEQLGCPHFCSQGIKIPIYCFGTKYLIDNSLFGGVSHMSEEEQSLLDSLLLAQWEERMWKGHFKYDITASEIKVIRGRRKFLAQLNSDRSMDGLQDLKKHKMCHQEDVLVFEQTKHCEELLFCITNGDKADSELIPSAAVPNDAILIVINVNPIEYGHVFLVPHAFDRLDQVLDARFLEMVVRVAVEINNCSFRLFYNCPRHSRVYFQACYFPDLLPVEHMPVDILFDAGQKGIHISTVIDYPIKTLLFASNCNFKIMVEVLAETCSCLLDKDIPYNLMISDCGKKVFLFLQRTGEKHICTCAHT